MVKVLFAIMALPMLALADPKINIYKGTEIDGPGYKDQIYSLQWNEDGTVEGTVSPLTFAKQKEFLIKGENFKAGQLRLELFTKANVLVATGLVTKNKDDEDGVYWNGELEFASPKSKREIYFYRNKKPFNEFELLHSNMTDGPVERLHIQLNCKSTALKAALEYIATIPSLVVTNVHLAPDDAPKERSPVDEDWDKPNKMARSHYEIMLFVEDGDSVELVKQLRKHPIFSFVDLYHDGAGAGSEDVVYLPKDKLRVDGKTNPERLRSCLLAGVQHLIDSNKDSKWKIELKKLGLKKTGAVITLQGPISGLTGSKGKQLLLLDYSFTVTQTENTPSDCFAIILNYLDGKWADPPLLGNKEPNDTWFTQEISSEHYARASGYFIKAIGAALNAPIELNGDSPFLDNN